MIASFKKKQKSRINPDSFFSSPFVKVFFLIIIASLIFINIRTYKDKRKFDSQIANFEEKIQELQKKNNALEQSIARTNDKDYIEKIAREELDLQMQNEKVISFITPKPQQEKMNTNGSFLNPKTWLGWFSSSWRWVSGNWSK